MSRTKRRRLRDGEPVVLEHRAARAERDLARAVAAHRAGDLRRAAIDYGQYLRVRADNAEVWHVLAGVHFQAGDIEAASAALEAAVRHAPENPAYLNDLAGVHLSRARPGDAEALLRRALELEPGYPEAAYNLGQALYDQGRVPEAIAVLQGLVRRQPQFAEAHYNLGVAQRGQGRAAEAAEAFENALRLQPDNVQAHLALGRLYRDQRFVGRALEHFARYLDAVPNDVAAAIEYAELLHDNGETTRAVERLRATAGIDRGNADVHVALGHVLHIAGEMDQAEAAFSTALAMDHGNTGAIIGLSRLRRFRDPTDPVAERLRSALAAGRASSVQEAALHFALGKIYDDIGDFDRAFEHFRCGNGIRHRDIEYDRLALEERVGRIVDVFSPQCVERLAGFGSASDLPVLFVGMPRSGTTLAEQVLASHPRAHGAGELRFFATLVSNLHRLLDLEKGYPECCPSLSGEAVGQITGQYLALLRRHSETALRVSDKLPGNYFHLGLIAGLFPNARVVSCRRNPLDTCLSVYFQFFREPHDYAWDLSDIAHFYAQYRRLMARWLSILPGRILELDYEDMVTDLEQTGRRLIEFCGLDWDPACLAFHETRRDVKTASNWQVRQPIYQSSLTRWKNYEKHLGPLAEMLSSDADRPRQG